eukprot:TRINITY_DN7749_c0_g1_i2.p1 TRINITY_DN7749_c0_g1~~TRINITY_DN7749_c0_g1_i2.p1  ORF type:complete len:242 (+),score=53.73 TRINITY_DN7749_c0_g1_i2:682-1407(+)
MECYIKLHFIYSSLTKNKVHHHIIIMRSLLILCFLLCGLALLVAQASENVHGVVIDYLERPDTCSGDDAIKAEKDDKVHVHYTGTLANGDVFDTSIKRGQPFQFTLGASQVIKGWDIGILGMCVGEKRRLTIPSELGYGKRGAAGGKIPPDATLIFETEMIKIDKHERNMINKNNKNIVADQKKVGEGKTSHPAAAAEERKDTSPNNGSPTMKEYLVLAVVIAVVAYYVRQNRNRIRDYSL